MLLTDKQKQQAVEAKELLEAYLAALAAVQLIEGQLGKEHENVIFLRKDLIKFRTDLNTLLKQMEECELTHVHNEDINENEK